MLTSKRLQILLLVYIVAICRPPSASGFTLEDCKQLNETANVTCYTHNKEQFNIDFSNEEHLKIYIYNERQKDSSSTIVSCRGTDAEVLQISDNLPKLLLERSSTLTIEGCIPFAGICEQLGISIAEEVRLQRGITDAPLKREHLSSLTMLKGLLISGFDALDENVLADFQRLETLELALIQSALPGGLLAPVSAHLRELKLRNNGIVRPTVGLFASLELLDVLDLSYNELTSIPSGSFDELYNLTDLDLSNNHLSHLPADVFRSLRKLQRLYISNNRLQQLELGTFATLSALEYLKLDNNTIDIASSIACSIFDGLHSLDYLELNHNSLSVYCIPQYTRSLSIDLSYNSVHELLLPSNKSQSRELVNLNVRHNQLQYLSDELLQYLHDSLAKISFAHNPWQCDEHSFLWLDFLKLNSERILDIAELQCTNDNTQHNVTLFKSSNICKSEPVFYYQIAIASLVVIALIALVCFKLKARRSPKQLNNMSTPEHFYENVVMFGDAAQS